MPEALTPGAEAPLSGRESRCRRALQPELSRRLLEELRAVPQTPCKLVSIRTERSVAVALYELEGRALPALRIAPSGCLDEPTRSGAELEVRVPAELGAACEAVAAEVPARITALALPPVVVTPGGPVPGGVEVAQPLFASEATVVTVLVVAGVAGALTLGSWLRAAGRAGRLALGAFAVLIAVALALRLATPPALANWYLEVASSVDVRSARFGPAMIVVQRLLGRAGVLDDTAIFAATSAFGALAVGLTAALARAASAPALVTAGAGIVLAWLPMHVRVSASGAEHVLASTATLAALLLLVHSTRARSPIAFVGSLACAALATLARVDAWPGLGVAPVWALASAAARRDPWSRRAALGFAIAWAALGALAYSELVLGSKHPAPTPSQVVTTLLGLPGSYLRNGLEAPRFLGASTLFLALAGTVWGVTRRSPIVLPAWLTLLAGHASVARDWHDGVLAGRYLLTALAAYAVLAGLGVDALAAGLERGVGGLRRVATLSERERLGGALAILVAAGAVAAVDGSEARAVRYTFQDEYDFLRRELAAAPAGCQVLQLELRPEAFRRDLDCCLAAPRSPLELAWPGVRVRAVPRGAAVRAAVEGATCTLYYEGAACSIPRFGHVLAWDEPAAAWLRRECEAALSEVHVEPLATAEVAARTTNDYFSQRPPRVTLYRLKPR